MRGATGYTAKANNYAEQTCHRAMTTTAHTLQLQRRMRFVWVCSIALAAAAGCAGALEQPERFGNRPDAGSCDDFDVVVDVFDAKCSASICHDPDEPAGELDLVTDGVEARLFDVASSCSARPLIDSANIDNSFLLEKLGGAPECGDPMPLAAAPLTAQEIGCVRSWAEGL